MIKKFTHLIMVLCYFLTSACDVNQLEVRVGIIHSLTGNMASAEKPLVDALLLAIDEINAKGGVLGHPVIPIIVDGKSDHNIFAKAAKQLITREHVSVIFGCGTSSCRKAVEPVIEQYHSLMFYAVQHEGLEQSHNIVYTGATLNQQVTPGITWALDHLGKRFVLIGSDDIFSRTANYLIRDVLTIQNATVLAQYYQRPGSTKDFADIVDEIAQIQPDVIVNTLYGKGNVAFFETLSNIKPIPVISYRIAEPEIAEIGSDLMAGHYALWNYFQSIDRQENLAFVAKFKKRFGQDRLISDPVEASYIAVHLWERAARSALSTHPLRVLSAIGRESFNAPEGVVSVDRSTLHLWKKPRLGQIKKDGQFSIVWQSDVSIRPVLYPSYQTKRKWQQILTTIQDGETR